MIKCFNCKKEVSDLVASTCRHCGYSISRSKENWIKLENAPPAKPITHFDFDIEADRDALYEIIVPAILDESNHYDVKIKIRKYFWKFDDIASGTGDSLTKNIEKFVASREKILDYSKKKNAEQADFALRTYKKQMDNIETPGLGFDIITNDAASAIAYTALSKHEVTKQYLKQANAAANQLVANLPFLTSNSMSQSDMFEYKHQIDQSLLLAQKLVDSNNYLADHPGFFSEPDQYDTGLTIGEHSVYDILRSITVPQKVIRGTKKVLGVPEVPQEIIDKMMEEGYLHQLGDRYCTSTKYERETLQALYWKEHPEEKQRVEAETASANQKAYQEAENLLACGKYYESAVAFSAISEYKDSAQRSVQIWRERILEKDRIAIHYSRVLGLRENGTVLVSGHSGRTDISDADMYTRVGQWRDIIAISNDNLPCGLDIEGKIHSITSAWDANVAQAFSKRNVADIYYLGSSGDNTYAELQENGRLAVTGAQAAEYAFLAQWEPITKLIQSRLLYDDLYGSIDKAVIGLTKDGRVLCESKSEILKQELSKWTNIVDLICENGFIGLRADGTVVTFLYKHGLSYWKNVVGIFTSFCCAVGICADGTVLSAGECNHEELRNWKLFQHVDTRNQYMDGKKKQLLDAYSAELESCRRELANTRGIFAGSKKKKLEKRIMELQAKIK